MYFVFIGILVLRYQKYQGCDILLSVILELVPEWTYYIRVFFYVSIYTDSTVPYVSSVPVLFYLYSLCFVRILYTVIPDPFGAAHSQFPEVVFVSIKCFAMGGGGCCQRIKNIYAQPHHMYKCNGGGGVCEHVFIMIYYQYRK
jgi:hypothetical protein